MQLASSRPSRPSRHTNDGLGPASPPRRSTTHQQQPPSDSLPLPNQTPICPSPLPQPKPISTLPILLRQEKESRHQLATQRLEWAKEVLRFVQRTQPTLLSPTSGSKSSSLLGLDLVYDINDNSLLALIDTAITFILSLAHPAKPPSPVSANKLYAEAMFLSADLSSSGLFPKYKAKDLRTSFRAFETSAKAGFLPAWFRLGRDYEGVGDASRAIDCFNKGANGMEKSCLYVSGLIGLGVFCQVSIQMSG